MHQIQISRGERKCTFSLLLDLFGSTFCFLYSMPLAPFLLEKFYLDVGLLHLLLVLCSTVVTLFCDSCWAPSHIGSFLSLCSLEGMFCCIKLHLESACDFCSAFCGMDPLLLDFLLCMQFLHGGHFEKLQVPSQLSTLWLQWQHSAHTSPPSQ